MKEYTYERWERMRCVDRIDGLSIDAAIEVARANSIVSRCTVSAHHCRDSFGTEMVTVIVFEGGRQTNKYIASAEED